MLFFSCDGFLKSQLQELIQRDGSGSIEYQILQEKGPAHNREFISRVTLNGVALGLGSGKIKKRKRSSMPQRKR
ncbi:hypothetical protein GCM10020331_047590 [Ectobacillus funiculus]